MPALPHDLRRVLAEVKFRPESGFIVAGKPIEIPKDGRFQASDLATALYDRLYCRLEPSQSPRADDFRTIRTFGLLLSNANCGRGTWEHGWVVRGFESDGMLVLHNAHQDLTMWAAPSQFRAHGDVAIGSIGRLWIGKETREMLPGYYMALGDADQDEDPFHPQSNVVRFYFHLVAAAAPLWLTELTRRFNVAGVPFRAKALSNPGSYVRADSGVLYILQRDVARALTLLVDLYDAIARGLRRTVPMFTKRLAPGLAVAEDPGNGQSFGQHRCELVADGFVRAFANGSTNPADATVAIASRFAEAGLNIARPWLSAGSRNVYRWPAERVSRNLRATHS